VTELLAAPVGGAPVPLAAAPWRVRLQPLASRGGWLASLAVTLLAGLLRFVRLDLPYNGDVGGKIFDEVYYACDAQNLLRYGVEHVTESGPLAGQCLPTGSGSFVVHPPLGKWAIALGLKIFGTSTFGWRVMAALAGTLTVLVVIRVGRRMTGSTLLGCLAGLLLAVDGLHLVQSRIAMLDVFLVLWTTAAFACLVCDRDQVRARLAATPPARPFSSALPLLEGGSESPENALSPGSRDRDRLGVRWWRLAAGLCLGAAVATKWSGVYYLAVLGVLSLAWEVGARRTAGQRAPFRATLRRSVVPLTGSLLLLPFAVYLLSWAGWFTSDIGYDRQWASGRSASGPAALLPDALRSLWHYHQQILVFHEGLSSPHQYQSHPAGWLLLARPISYYYPLGITSEQSGCHAASCAREVLAIGNPVLWWGTLPVLLALVWLWVSRRDWRAAAVVALIAAGILPWVRDDLHERTMFLFYALPAVPFMALGAALVAGWLLGGKQASQQRRRWGAAAVGTYTALAVGAFAFFYPVLTALTITLSQWQQRMWFPSWV